METKPVKNRTKNSDLWIGALLGTGLFFLAEALSSIGHPHWQGDFLSRTFYFHITVLCASGHYLAKGGKMPRVTKRLLTAFLVLPLAILLIAAVLTPTYWLVGFGNWGIVFSCMCTQILPATLIIFLFIVLGHNFHKEKATTKEMSCYLCAAITIITTMVWFEDGFGLFTGILLSFLVVTPVVLVLRRTRRVGVAIASRS